MAGEWIKMRRDLSSDPAVIRIRRAVGLDVDTVVGKLHRLWSWADVHTIDGTAEGLDLEWIDETAAAPGFGAAMVAAGALDEVRALAGRRLDPALPACKAVGVRPLAAFLAGEVSLEGAIAAGQRETRNYVKRQEVWLRGRMADWPVITDADPEAQWRSFLALNPDLTP